MCSILHIQTGQCVIMRASACMCVKEENYKCLLINSTESDGCLSIFGLARMCFIYGSWQLSNFIQPQKFPCTIGKKYVAHAYNLLSHRQFSTQKSLTTCQ